MFKNTKNKDHDNYDEYNEDESENLSDVQYEPPNSSQDDNDDSYDSENELDCYDPEMKNYQFDKIKVKLLRGENNEPVFLKEGGGLRYIYYNQDDGFDDVFRRISKLYFPRHGRTRLGSMDKYEMRLLDFQKQILPPENFNIQDYLEHNGLYRYNTLFYFHIIPKDQNLSFDSTQSEENIEETLPTRPITRTFSRNLETESQTPPATQSQSPKRQTARKRARLIEPDTDSDFDSGRGSLLTNKEAPYKIALKKLRESREKRMSTSSFASSSSSVLKKSIDESYYLENITTDDVSECLCIENMFTSSKRLDSKSINEIKQKVIDKLHIYGGIVHCELFTSCPNVHVYVKCKSTNTAIETMENINDSEYEGKTLTVNYVLYDKYIKKFPGALYCEDILKPINYICLE